MPVHFDINTASTYRESQRDEPFREILFAGTTHRPATFLLRVDRILYPYNPNVFRLCGLAWHNLHNPYDHRETGLWALSHQVQLRETAYSSHNQDAAEEVLRLLVLALACCQAKKHAGRIGTADSAAIRSPRGSGPTAKTLPKTHIAVSRRSARYCYGGSRRDWLFDQQCRRNKRCIGFIERRARSRAIPGRHLGYFTLHTPWSYFCRHTGETSEETSKTRESRQQRKGRPLGHLGRLAKLVLSHICHSRC